MLQQNLSKITLSICEIVGPQYRAFSLCLHDLDLFFYFAPKCNVTVSP